MADYPDEQHVVKILETSYITHNVKRFRLQKPDQYVFTPGQATDITIHLPEWEKERRPFTFTSLNEWDFLEFTIKIYSDHEGVTHKLAALKPGDELVIHDVWGAIHYKGEGVFIAGGAGITPVIAILRQLYKEGRTGNNRLLFSNRTSKDIILKEELEKMLGSYFINTLTEEKNPLYDHRKIDEGYLREKITDVNQYFYICGPDPMIEAVSTDLQHIGVPKDNIVVEQF